MVHLNSLEGCLPLVKTDAGAGWFWKGEPYVALLTDQIREIIRPGGFTVANRLARTALTDLFQQKHDVEIDKLTQGRNNALGLVCWAQEHGFRLRYRVTPADSSGPARTFWQVEASESDSSLDMFCIADKPPVPLHGEGNITFITGVREAIIKDIGTVLGRTPEEF